MSHNSAFHRTAAAQRGPLTLVPLPPGMAPTVDAVVPDAAFKPSVDDGGVFHVTFAAGRVPPAPVALPSASAPGCPNRARPVPT
jgi:hypothetical protein